MFHVVGRLEELHAHVHTFHVVKQGFMNPASCGTMDELARQAGAGDTVRAYLEARGILSVGTSAMVARDEASCDTTVIAPLLQGFQTSAGMLELPEVEQPIAKAVLLYMWNLAREARAAAGTHTTCSGSRRSPVVEPHRIGYGAPYRGEGPQDTAPQGLAGGRGQVQCGLRRGSPKGIFPSRSWWEQKAS